MTKYTYSLVFLTLAIFLTSITSAFSQETVDSLAVQKGEQIYKAKLYVMSHDDRQGINWTRIKGCYGSKK